MTIGSHSIGEVAIGEEAGVETINLYATIDLDTQPVLNLFAPISLITSDAITPDLYATVDLATDSIASLVADIDARPYVAISPDLSASISLQTADQTTADAATGYWTLEVLIGGTDVSSKLTGVASVEYEEDASGIANVEIYPDAGAFLLTDYVSKTISITHHTCDSVGNCLFQTNLFKGYISDPYFDPDRGVLSLQCTTDLQGRLDASTRTQITATVGGNWSPFIFEEGAQGYTYATDRMRTRSASMWHSPNGIIITDWAAKATADIEFDDSQVLDGSIGYQTATRRDLLNKVNISFDYRYQRLRQRFIAVNFTMSQTFCEFLINGFKLCQRSMVEGAANGDGWVVQGDITYTPLPPAGYYKCFPFAIGPSATKYIGWGRLVGGFLLEDDDVDALCWGASWRASRRWAQTVTERYSLQILAPQSQTGNGDIVQTESYSVVSDQDVSDWVDRAEFDGTGDKTGFENVDGTASDLGDLARDVTDDALTGRTAADMARQVAIEVSVADVLRAHRQTSVAFASTFQPYVDLRKTVRLNTSHVVAKGKVKGVVHSFGIETGQAETEITLALSRHFGSGIVSSSPVEPDDAPEKTVETDIPTQINLGSRVGGLTTSTAFDEDWTGYFSNYIFDPTDTEPFATDPSNPQAVVYPEKFVCEYPEISGGALDATEVPAAQTLSVEIPLDELTLTQ